MKKQNRKGREDEDLYKTAHSVIIYNYIECLFQYTAGTHKDTDDESGRDYAGSTVNRGGAATRDRNTMGNRESISNPDGYTNGYSDLHTDQCTAADSANRNFRAAALSAGRLYKCNGL